MPPLNVVKLGFVNKIPDNLSFEEASMSELLACCINAQEVANVGSGDTVVIIGAGPAGCIHVELAKARGVRKIILAQRSEARLKMARIFNPDVLINSQNENYCGKSIRRNKWCRC